MGPTSKGRGGEGREWRKRWDRGGRRGEEKKKKWGKGRQEKGVTDGMRGKWEGKAKSVDLPMSLILH